VLGNTANRDCNNSTERNICTPEANWRFFFKYEFGLNHLKKAVLARGLFRSIEKGQIDRRSLPIEVVLRPTARRSLTTPVGVPPLASGDTANTVSKSKKDNCKWRTNTPAAYSPTVLCDGQA
jgi:hypothetical protein